MAPQPPNPLQPASLDLPFVLEPPCASTKPKFTCKIPQATDGFLESQDPSKNWPQGPSWVKAEKNVDSMRSHWVQGGQHWRNRPPTMLMMLAPLATISVTLLTGASLLGTWTFYLTCKILHLWKLTCHVQGRKISQMIFVYSSCATRRVQGSVLTRHTRMLIEIYRI